jgi:solute carrier family 25 (mitochondrial oxoglutarate transporter), member 11
LKLENFRLAMKTRSQYALCIGSTDIAARVSLFRYFNNGWQRPWGGFEYTFVRKIPGTLLMSALSAPISIPFELARMAYYGDKSFPPELRKNYTSFFNTLRRIPFEEGPYFLFKNSSPIFVRNFFQTFTLFYTYDFLKDKCSWLWRIMDTPYLPSRMFLAAFSSYLACVFSYPWAVMTRELVDFWPKPKDGLCPWNGNYRKAGVWLWYHQYGSNLFPGFFNNYFWKQAPWMFATLIIADTLGIFTYWSVDMMSGPGTNSWEDIVS